MASSVHLSVSKGATRCHARLLPRWSSGMVLSVHQCCCAGLMRWGAAGLAFWCVGWGGMWLICSAAWAVPMLSMRRKSAGWYVASNAILTRPSASVVVSY